VIAACLYYVKSRLRDVPALEILSSFLCLCHTDVYFTFARRGAGVLSENLVIRLFASLPALP
jgi:hypothetical protein